MFQLQDILEEFVSASAFTPRVNHIYRSVSAEGMLHSSVSAKAAYWAERWKDPFFRAYRRNYMKEYYQRPYAKAQRLESFAAWRAIPEVAERRRQQAKKYAQDPVKRARHASQKLAWQRAHAEERAAKKRLARLKTRLSLADNGS